MAIITKSSSVEKGNEVEFTLNITDLLAHASVSGDAYFSVQSNWDKVFLNYKSAGYQKEILVFNDVDSGTSSVANFGVFSDARDLFEVHSVIIMDKQGGCLKIKRSDLVAAEFDVDFSVVSGGVSYDVAALNTTSESEYASGSGGALFARGTAIDFLSDGSIIVTSSKSGEKIKKFNVDGSNNETFDTNFARTITGTLTTVLVDSNDDIYVPLPDGGSIKLDSDGNEITSFATNYGTPAGGVFDMIEIPDGSLLICGTSTFGWVKRINKDGTDFIGNSFNSNVSGNFSSNDVYAAGLLSDNSIVLVGGFIYDDGVNTFTELVVLNDDGTINLAKTNLYTNNNTYHISGVKKLKIINDDLYLTGNGTMGINGNRSFGSILSDGNINTTFQDNVNAIHLFDYFSAINDMVFADNGRILLCSKAQNIGGTANRHFFIAVNSDGTLDSDFTTNNLDNKFTSTGYVGFEGITHGSFNSDVFFVIHQGEIDSANHFMFAISNT